MRKKKEIPPVPHEYLMAANMTAFDNAETLDQRGFVDAVAAALDGISDVELESVIHRLIALANNLEAGDGENIGWRGDINGNMFVEEPLFRAAARARLIAADNLEDLRFDPKELFSIALGETTPHGNA